MKSGAGKNVFTIAGSHAGISAAFKIFAIKLF